MVSPLYLHDFIKGITKADRVFILIKQPNWSPQGDRILYQEEENGWIIKTIDINGNNPVVITGNDESATDTVFSYDGRRIIYSLEKEGIVNANIYKKLSETGGRSIRITNYKGYDGAPSISPDGSQVVFESSTIPGDNTKIWIIDLED